MGIWEEAERLIASGQGVVITLTEAHEVHLPKRRSRRCRKRLDRPWQNYLGSDGLSRPRCRRKGCQKYLRKNQPAVCSTRCRQLLIEECVLALELVDYYVEPIDPEREIEESMAMREAELAGRWAYEARLAKKWPKPRP